MQQEKKKGKKQGGRPPKAPEKRKTVQLKIWVTPSDAVAIKQKAEAAGFKHSGQFMAKAILERVNGTTPAINFKPVDMRNLASLANSLNKIAKQLHNGDDYDPEMQENVLYVGRLVRKLGQELCEQMRNYKNGIAR